MAYWETTLGVYSFQALVLSTQMENNKYQIKERGMSSKLPRLLEKDFLQEYCVAKGAESSKQEPSVFCALYCSVAINVFEKPFTARDLQSSLQGVRVSLAL